MWAKWLEWKLLGTRAAGRGRGQIVRGRSNSRVCILDIYIYIYLQSFFLLFFLIRREIGQIKIRSEVRVALEFTRFLVTRGSNVLTRDRIFFFFFHVNGKFYRNFSHSTFSRKRTVNSREKLLSYFSATWRFSRIVRTSRLFPFMIDYASSRD